MSYVAANGQTASGYARDLFAEDLMAVGRI